MTAKPAMLAACALVVLLGGQGCRRGEGLPVEKPETEEPKPWDPPMTPREPMPVYYPRSEADLAGKEEVGEAIVADIKELCRKLKQPRVPARELAMTLGTLELANPRTWFPVAPYSPLYEDISVHSSYPDSDDAESIGLRLVDQRALGTRLLKRHFGIPRVNIYRTPRVPVSFKFENPVVEKGKPIQCVIIAETWINPATWEPMRQKAHELARRRGLTPLDEPLVRGEMIDGVVYSLDLQRSDERQPEPKPRLPSKR